MLLLIEFGQISYSPANKETHMQIMYILKSHPTKLQFP